MLRRSRIRIRKEALPAIAEMLYKNFKRDQDDFKTYFPKLDQAFLTQFQKHIQQVKKLPNAITITRKLIHYIEEMHSYILSITLHLETYDFSFAEKGNKRNSIQSILSSLRKRAQRNDIKGTIKQLDDLIIELKQIKEETGDRFMCQNFLDGIIFHRDNLQKTHQIILRLLKKRSAMVNRNETIRDQLRDKIYRISRAGKSLYRMMTPAKMQDYDISKLLKKRNLNPRNNHRLPGMLN